MDSSNNFNLLPKHLIDEILIRVAASSVFDLLNAKMSCTLFNELGNSKYVYQRVSIDEIPPEFDPMKKPKMFSFYRKCVENENPEAMYREGLFSLLREESNEQGFEFLDIAARSGHVLASFVLGINLVCTGNENDKERGMKMLENANIKTSPKMKECRRLVTSTLVDCMEYHLNRRFSIDLITFMSIDRFYKRNFHTAGC